MSGLGPSVLRQSAEKSINDEFLTPQSYVEKPLIDMIKAYETY